MFLIGGLGIGKIIVIKGIVELYVEIYGFLFDYDDYNEDDYLVVLVVFIGCVFKCFYELIGLEVMIIYCLIGWN